MSQDKPTLRLALLERPGDDARRLLLALHGGVEERWWAEAESETFYFELFVGMPPGGQVHGALVLLDLNHPVEVVLKRAIWSAKRRRVTRFLGLLLSEQDDPELCDIEEALAREALEQLGLRGDEAPMLSLRASAPDAASLLSWLGQHLSYFEAPQREVAAPPSEIFRFARKMIFEGSGLPLDNSLWSDFRRGEFLSSSDRSWRLHSILYQAMCGYFDDVPALIFLAKYYPAAERLLSYTGGDELLSLMPFEPPAHPEDGACFPWRYWRCWCSLPAGALSLEAMSSSLERFRAGMENIFWVDTDTLTCFVDGLQALRRLLGQIPLAPSRIVSSETMRGRPAQRGTGVEIYLMLPQRRQNYMLMKSVFNVAKIRYESTVARHPRGTLLWFDQPFSVRGLAERIQAEEISLSDWWLMFSAQTGCLFNTQEALSDWLRSPAPEQYTAGVRYFFGNPIPVFPG